jgi:hypothetical protein
MIENTTSIAPASRSVDFGRAFNFLLHPRNEMIKLVGNEKASWLTPMLILSIALLLRVLVSGYLQVRAAAMGEISLPPDWQFWTPEMQNNYMQAIQTTQGPAFVYVIPIVSGLIKLWLGWVLLAGLFHLLSTLLGGRGAMRAALNVVAWASLPFAVRDLLRVVFMLVVGHPISSPGLSGFGGSSVFAAQLLANLDLFFIWHAVLMVIGTSLVDSLSVRKAALAVSVVLIISLLTQAGLGSLSATMSGFMVNRPFF